MFVSPFDEFKRGIREKTEESLKQSLEKLREKPEIAKEFDEESRHKFVDIFSKLPPGETGKVPSLLYEILSELMSQLAKEGEDSQHFRGLQYIADMIIRRHLENLYLLMDRNRGALAIGLLVKAAKVDSNHCRELFNTLIRFGSKNDSRSKFRNQADGDGRKQYIELATVFLRNPEIRFEFLGTKYYISSIWKKLANDDRWVANDFLNAMIEAIKPANPATKRWVFKDNTLKTIAQYQFNSIEPDGENKVDPHYSMYRLLQTVLTGENSMIVEKPMRVYCRHVTDLESPPKNTDLLEFLRQLDPWKKPSHRDLATFIFKQSPDLIARYMVDAKRHFDSNISLANGSALVFISSVIELDWPEFLNDMNFVEEERSLELLFESILPSMLKNSYIAGLLNTEKKDFSNFMAKEMLVILSKAIIKFRKLPDSLKQGHLYTILRGRLVPATANILLAAASKSVLAPFALKLLHLMDQVFPFFISDSIRKDPKIVADFASLPQMLQVQIMKVIPLLPSSTMFKQIPVLCSLIHDENTDVKIRFTALECLKKIAASDDVFEGHEEEIAILVGEALTREDGGKDLNERIQLVRGARYKYAKDNGRSLVYNAMTEKSPLLYARSIIDAMYDPSNDHVSDLNLSPPVILGQMKWWSIESTVVLLCASIANAVSDLSFTLNCLRMVVSFCPERTLPYVLNNPFIKGVAFTGSETIDREVALFIKMNQGCDDDLACAFLDGNVTAEVAEEVAPFIGMTKPLIKKLLGMKLSIREILTSDEEISTDHLKPFWKWAFKDFIPINLTRIWPGLLKRIDDELLILNIMRTMYIKKDTSLLPHLVVPESTSDKRLQVMIAEMLPDKIGHTDSLPVCFLLNRQFHDPVTEFERTHKDWAYDYLLQQIRIQQFSRVASRLNKEKVKEATIFMLSHPGGAIIDTFGGHIKKYLIKHPEVAVKPPVKSALFDEVVKVITEPANLVKYKEVEQFEGIVNLILGAPRVLVSLRTAMYLATKLANSPSFYRMLEDQRISGPSFLFVTGEVAKTTIQTIFDGQTPVPAGLCRSTSYLAPFHMAHQNVAVDTPMFRFLLHFANHLLTEFKISIDVFMKSGALSVLMKALSSKDEESRKVAYATLSVLYEMNMENKEWKYYKQLAILLESLLNAVNVPNKRFTSLISYFLACASSIIVKPSHPIFMVLVKFLVSAPALRCGSVPLFSDLFGSDSTEYRTERTYILDMMKVGIMEESDVDLLLKGKVIERLTGFFASPLADKSTRALILDVLKVASKFTKLPHIVMWVYSILNEPFATEFHLDKLLDLALSIKGQTGPEKDCCVLIAREAIANLTDRMSNETRWRLEEILSQS